MTTDYSAFHVRVTGNGWISVDCKACKKPLLSATHMDLADITAWADKHQQAKHPDGMPETVTYKCPLTGEDESSLGGDCMRRRNMPEVRRCDAGKLAKEPSL